MNCCEFSARIEQAVLQKAEELQIETEGQEFRQRLSLSTTPPTQLVPQFLDEAVLTPRLEHGPVLGRKDSPAARSSHRR